jgi:ubiquinone/menaquinone biosynthesis C-methylase UbiE
MLEVGPGTGAYTFETAGALGSAGRLDVLDVQEKMLAHTMRAAGRLGLDNIVPEQGDAGTLPYDDDSFDAAYLITVLGEIGDQDAALRELRRVLKPGGRLVVGEIALDPDWISLGTLRQQTSAASLRYDCHIGNTLSYLARFRAD